MKKTVVITGGSSGIGRACAELYATKGFYVVFTGREEERLKHVLQSIEEKGGEADYIVKDAANTDGAKKVIDFAIKKYGTLDVLICNAGVSQRAMFEDVDLDVFEEIMKINLMGTVKYVKFALPYLVKSQGSIVGVSSINGYRGTPGRTAYSASKFAMQGFFESLRLEMKAKGVHVMVINPGYTSTNIRKFALRGDGVVQGESPRDESKMMSAEKVAKYLYYGQTHHRRDVILTLLGKALIFLNKRFPRWMDRTVYRVMKKEDPELFTR
ncbi:SDR family oxidoreductase [Reichenbachiella versicolor]|uniref:SDR family oxidoreductase n=1 Tax=Reichenbachiella versicolor TaxID=1821036 RepID=UPI000D6DDF7F|nr:SDR family oxidoreductase [Reichenbachiella versicolor]